MFQRHLHIALVLAIVVCASLSVSAETLPPLRDGKAPTTHDELWAGFDPQKEPLDVEVLKEWEEDGVILRVLRYKIGVFKGRKAMMAAVYGFPKGGSNLPGLVQIHGGGQFADHRAPLMNAKRGYATISISWAGRISAPGYTVSPSNVQLFFDDKKDDPNYRLTTDWGALDGYHAPSRNQGNSFLSVAAHDWTLDPVESPRNNPWFLCTLGARRALTFLERQPEVDKERLGVYGHSMGGKLTVLTTAADSRVKAAAPSCGGISNRDSDYPLYASTVGDSVSLKRIKCPIIFLSPANDFHGRIDDLQTALTEIQTDEWRVTCSPHHNHQDTGEYEGAAMLWFDQHFRKSFQYPQTPKLTLSLKNGSGTPVVIVEPDVSAPILGVEVYYTQHGKGPDEEMDMKNVVSRFWNYAPTAGKGNVWSTVAPLNTTDRPLWVYANVRYALDEPVTGAGYYYRSYSADTYVLSSKMQIASLDELKTAGVKSPLGGKLLIEDFKGDWQKEWFTYRPESWGMRTHKVYSDQWKAPKGARLALEVKSANAGKIVIGIDDYAAEVELAGEGNWSQISLPPGSFLDAVSGPLENWEGIKELRFVAKETLRKRINGEQKTRVVGSDLEGAAPELRNLRWVIE